MTPVTAGTYDTKTVGTGKGVTVTGLTLTGTDAANYALASTTVTGTIGTITAKALTASLTGMASKVYDGTTGATLTAGNLDLTGVLGTEAVSLTPVTAGTYDTKTVGTGKGVTVTGLTLTGTDAANYTLASTTVTGAIGTITAKALTDGDRDGPDSDRHRLRELHAGLDHGHRRDRDDHGEGPDGEPDRHGEQGLRRHHDRHPDHG
ncbi:YDG domain-containing protein [Zavarzinia compransoris]|uniref:YDG domain-containing protein n=1 Tax=Zavarzinia compransoris TaxID=1264899 RepID=UPI003CC8243B